MSDQSTPTVAAPDSFRFAVNGLASKLACSGTIKWNELKRQWQATITVTTEPLIEVHGFSEYHGEAALRAIASWAGYGSNAEVSDGV